MPLQAQLQAPQATNPQMPGPSDEMLPQPPDLGGGASQATPAPQLTPYQQLMQQMAELSKQSQSLMQQLQQPQQPPPAFTDYVRDKGVLDKANQMGTAKLALTNLLRSFAHEPDIKSALLGVAHQDWQEETKNQMQAQQLQRQNSLAQLQDLRQQQSSLQAQLPYIQEKEQNAQKNYTDQTDKLAGLRGYKLDDGQAPPKGYNTLTVQKPGVGGAAPTTETWAVPGAGYEADQKKVPVNIEMINALHLVDDKGQPLQPGALVPEELQRAYVTNMAAKVGMFKSPQEVTTFVDSLVDKTKYPQLNGRLAVTLNQAASMPGEEGNSLARGAIQQVQEEMFKKENVDPGVGEARATQIALQEGQELDRVQNQYVTPYKKTLADIDSKLDRISYTEHMLQQPGAVPSVMAIPELLTAVLSGQGSGVRLTQGELQSIAKARGVVGDVQAFIGGLTGQSKLGDDQRKQMQGILSDVKSRLLLKAAINNQVLDKIQGAGSKSEVIQADRDARSAHEAFVQLEPGGGKPIDAATATLIKTAASGDKTLAQKIAQTLGWAPPK